MPLSDSIAPCFHYSMSTGNSDTHFEIVLIAACFL